LVDKFIHIISLDVPFPADYGGAIDIYYRINALHELGYKIILHCWEYGRGEQEKLKENTHEVHYYKRKKSLRYALSKLPFIVVSRQSEKLLTAFWRTITLSCSREFTQHYYLIIQD